MMVQCYVPHVLKWGKYVKNWLDKKYCANFQPLMHTYPTCEDDLHSLRPIT